MKRIPMLANYLTTMIRALPLLLCPFLCLCVAAQEPAAKWDAMKALASVLYREDKIEESAAILDKLPKTN